jgi:E3 ubiquitin-protein ligase ZNF598
MMDETCILLQFNCPESTCDYSASGWNDLRLHVRGIHSKMMWYVSLILNLLTV